MRPNQARYPVLIESLVEIPILMLMQEDLLRDPLNRLHPMMVQGKLQLRSRVESVGKQHRAEGVSEKASSLIIQDGAKGQMPPTNLHGRSGAAGALNSALIPFHMMSVVS